MKYGHGGDIYTYEGMIDFSANINPFGPSRKVLDAVASSAMQIGAYPDSRCRKLRQALAEREEVPGEMLVFGNGAADLIFSLVFAERPRKALLTAPSFSEYAQALGASGCEIIYHYLEEERNFCLGDDYLDCLTDDIDMIFLCSPDNPTGQVIGRELLSKIIEKCGERGIRIVLDECFYEFTKCQEDVAGVPDAVKFPWLFLMRAFTKMYAMPGLRLGYGICSDMELLERLSFVRQPWSVSVTAQAAGVAALGEPERVAQTRHFVNEERKIMEKELERIGVRYFPSSANYMLLKSEYDLYTQLKKKNILIRDCSNYIGLTEGFYRVAVKNSEQNRMLLGALEEIYYRHSPDADIKHFIHS